MADYRQLEEQFSANLGLERRPVAITAMTAVPRGREVYRHGTIGMQFLAHGIGGTHVLHGAERSLQLRDWRATPTTSRCLPTAPTGARGDTLAS